jgi:BirA family transcriptional regulator, biotin operon repressor / biotin---[acetyl-CoA-carboxylase] ligase
MISQNEIAARLRTRFVGRNIALYDNIDSTNLEALRLIENSKISHGTLVIAKIQTFGRGQQDHAWVSPSGGLYISIVTASKVAKTSNLITFVSGLSCIDAIREITGITASLKWVNDIVYNRKKLGGILTETVTRGQISTNVSGIGINVNSKVQNPGNAKFKPASLAELCGKDLDINSLIAAICNCFEYYFSIYQEDPNKITDKWLEYSNIMGLEINFMVNNKYLKGITTGINELGHLLVKVEDEIYTLTSTKNSEIIYPE